MSTSQKNNKPGQAEDFIRIQDLFFLCLSKWKWFVLSLLVTLSIATTYILRTQPVYTRSADMLIKDDSKGKSVSSDMESFADFGLFQANTNINNELIALRSPALMTEVVKRLRLEMNYLVDGRFHKRVAYGATLPVTVSMLNLPENEQAAFTLRLLADGSVELSDFIHNGEKIVEDEVIKGKLLDTISAPLGKMVITPSLRYEKGTEETLYVSRSSLYATVRAYTSGLTISLSEEKSSVVNLSFKDVSTQRAEDLLSTLISVYNENWVKDKNQIAISTSRFIDERLKVIETELGNVDSNISSYKSANLLPDVQAASNMYMAQSNETNARILELNNQLYMTRYIRNYLDGETNKNQLLPANSGIESSNIESQIRDYNTKLLQRNSLVSNSSEQNPLVIDLDQTLEAMRKSIITSIDNQLVTLDAQIRTLQQNEQQTTARIAANPSQAKYLLSVERQQKVKESLYLFLLQKREENELSQAFTAYNTRIITPPNGSQIPTAPVRRNILLVAFALGLLIPVVILFVLENMNNSVRGRKDLEGVTLPLVGEVPLLPQKRKRWFGKKQPETRPIVVKEGKRDVINEAFRVLRTNLEFMTGKKDGAHVILVTSFNPGSGKTFLTMNTAVSLAIKGKKVLVIDGDLRRGTISSYVDSPDRGLSDYLGKRVNNLDKIIVANKKHANLHVLPAGTIPPNPSELLFENRLEESIDDLRGKYDYIFIDCPPIDIVADTQIIEKLADRMVFVVRAGLLERGMLLELEDMYRKERFKGMSMILNGTSSERRYGYRYGYKYKAYHTPDTNRKGFGRWLPK